MECRNRLICCTQRLDLLISIYRDKGVPTMANLFILNFPTSRSSLRRVSALPSSNGSGPVILELPLEKIRRPLMRTRANDPDKVKDLMDSIQEIGLQAPIDVLEVDGVYYGFSGCHRYEAHQCLRLPTIRCKIRRGTKETLRHHLR
ncbi:sulfiredoxin, chloroplastic/mitochondrial-like isoform X2 [Cucurbita maxima]|uniref:sulfiredoxin n=1 Tax=Cucurbita maxima TaxID=3661 RepID=A0A6J1K2N2_CUCMA|nr:sulfiredoxin, chloroplastic/mitochondrial-like isoform X2 [Cucurbita maxima]